MTAKATYGPVESAYRAWVGSLDAALTLRQRATVAQVYALARALDHAPDEPLSATATVSRELRQLADEMRDAGHVGIAHPDTAAAGPPPDGVADLQAERRRRTGGASV